MGEEGEGWSRWRTELARGGCRWEDGGGRWGGVESSDGGWMRDAGWTRRVHRRVDAGTSARHANFSHEDAERRMPGVDATFDWQATQTH
jgi:hypothetical protein